MDTSPPAGYSAARHALAFAELPGRGTLLIRAADAVPFVDKFTTASLATLRPGSGTEAFFTDARGWVIALTRILRDDAGLMIDADAAVAAGLAAHLEHHHIREAVEIVDASAEWSAIALIGPAAEDWLATRGVLVPAGLHAHAGARLGPAAATIARADWCGPMMVVRTPARDAAPLAEWLVESGVPHAGPATVETVRIEERHPAPIDIGEKTLPQELDRPAASISFTKGCYLGQETVARIDALGHVNRRLTGVACVDGPPRIGAEVRQGDELVGTISSSCLAPRLGHGLGLALLRNAAPDAPLTIDGGAGRAIPLPLPSGTAS